MSPQKPWRGRTPKRSPRFKLFSSRQKMRQTSPCKHRPAEPNPANEASTMLAGNLEKKSEEQKRAEPKRKQGFFGRKTSIHRSKTPKRNGANNIKRESKHLRVDMKRSKKPQRRSKKKSNAKKYKPPAATAAGGTVETKEYEAARADLDELRVRMVGLEDKMEKCSIAEKSETTEEC